MLNPELSRYIYLSRIFENLKNNLLKLEVMVGTPLKIFPRLKEECPITRHAPAFDSDGRKHTYGQVYRFEKICEPYNKYYTDYFIQDMNDAYRYSQLLNEDKKVIRRNVFKWLLQRSSKWYYRVLNWFL